MIQAASASEEPKHIVFAGKTGIHVFAFGSKWQGVPSGNAYNGVTAAVIADGAEKRPDQILKPVKITAITNLGEATDNIHSSVREKFHASGAEVLSPPDSRLYVHLYQPGTSSLDSESISKRFERQSSIDPNQIPAVRKLSPDVLVVGGAITADPKMIPGTLALMKDARAKDSLVVLDIYPGDPVNSEMANTLASTAHIVKVSESRLQSLWPDQNDYKSAGRILNMGLDAQGQPDASKGPYVVMVTKEKGGFSMFWKEYVEAKRPVIVLDPKDETRTRKIPDSVKSVGYTTRHHSFHPHTNVPLIGTVRAQDFLNGAIARSLAEFDVTPQKLSKALAGTPEPVPEGKEKNPAKKTETSQTGSELIGMIGERAQNIQIHALTVANLPPAQRPGMMQLVATAKRPGQIIRQVHPTSAP